MTSNDEEFLLVTTNMCDSKWINRKQATKEQYSGFLNKINTTTTTCNTLKGESNHCVFKCKTRGIILTMSNCGIALSFRELFGSESLTQVTMLYLDTLDYFIGEYDYLMNRK